MSNNNINNGTLNWPPKYAYSFRAPTTEFAAGFAGYLHREQADSVDRAFIVARAEGTSPIDGWTCYASLVMPWHVVMAHPELSNNVYQHLSREDQLAVIPVLVVREDGSLDECGVGRPGES